MRNSMEINLTPGRSIMKLYFVPFACSLALPSCLRYATLRERLASEAVVAQNDAADEKKKARAVHHGQQHKRKHH